MLRTASGTRTQRAGDGMIEHRNGDGGLVNDNFKVADAIMPLVRVGELQRHGMTVTISHESLVSRNWATRLPGRNWNLKHSIGIGWMSLRRWENGLKFVTLVDLGRAVSASRGLVGFTSTRSLADIARVDTDASVLATANTPEPSRNQYTCRYTRRTGIGASAVSQVEDSSMEQWKVQSCNRGRYERCRRSRKPWRSHKYGSWTRLSRCRLWCNARFPWFRRCTEPGGFAGADDWHRKSDRSSMVECDFIPLSSRVEVASAGWTISNMTEVEIQSMITTATTKAVSDIPVRLSLAALFVWGRLDAKLQMRA